MNEIIGSAERKDRISLVIGGILIMATQFSISARCNAIFVIPICESLGFARGVFSWSDSFMYLGGVTASLFSGKVFSRFGIVRTMRVAAFFGVLFYFLKSFASTIPQFYAIHFLLEVCLCLSCPMPLSLLIGERFKNKRNTVVGIVMMGSGFGISVFNKVASDLILAHDWRYAVRALAVVLACFYIVTYYVLVREIKNSGAEESAKEEAPASERTLPEGPSEPFFNTKRTAIAVLCSFISVAAGTFMSTITPHLQDIGYSQSYAAAVYSASMLSMAAGKIFHGLIIDRWGVRVSNSVMILTALTGVIGVMTYASDLGAVLVCVGMMFISSLSVVGAPALAEALGGMRNKKYYVGKISAFISVGYAVAPFLYGSVYDRVGSYTPMYYVAAVILALCFAGILLLFPGRSESLAGK